jgi:hypothetical protein
VITVLFPLAIQFSHAFQKHEYSVINTVHFENANHPKTECNAFHIHINYNAIYYYSDIYFSKSVLIEEKIVVNQQQKESVTFFNESLRAPPLFYFKVLS